MAERQSQDRTEKPTAKKIADARRKGNVPQSREVPSVLILGGGMGVFFFAGSWMLDRLIRVMREIYLGAGSAGMAPENMHELVGGVFFGWLAIVLPLMAVVTVAGVIGNVSQFGFLLTTARLTPNLGRLNPISGLRRLIALRSLVELVKAVFKISMISAVAYAVVHRHLDALPTLMQFSTGHILQFIAQVSLQVGLYVCFALMVMALLDFAYVKWQHHQDLRMTKQEVRDEAKQREGDPAVKARIRSVQREMARRRMMEAVPEATVVITNPTHFAVALKYEAGMQAPRVIAKGAGFVAQKIKAIASDNQVPLVENKHLARAIFKSTQIGDFIPADFYRAVAEILAYVYRLRMGPNR